MPCDRRPARALALALALALTAACVPDEPAATATATAAASSSTDASSSAAASTDGATSTTAATTSSTGASGESTSTAETAAETAAPPGCGDGVADPSEVCFDRVDAFEGAYFTHVALADLDDDGVLDLLVLRDPVDAALAAWRGLGDGTFSLSQVIPIDAALLDLAVLDPAQGSRPVALLTSYEAMVGRRLDAAVISEGGALGPLELVPGVDGERLAVGRFDGASRPDLLVAGGGATDVVLGAEPWPPPPLPLGGEPLALHSRPAVGDLNEDGLDDVVLLAPGLLLLLSDP